MEKVFIGSVRIMTVRPQPLVPYWDLFNQALPLHQESK